MSVVVDVRPAAERLMSGITFAITTTMAAAIAIASERSSVCEGCTASSWLQRQQRALPPGASAGRRCSRSQPRQATGFTQARSETRSPSNPDGRKINTAISTRNANTSW